MRNKNRYRISKKYPEELSFILERELEKLNLEKCKAWKVERDWCLSKEIDVAEFPEEIEYQQIIKLYGFRLQKKNLG